MIIEGTLQEISAQWIAVRVAGATQPVRFPINDGQAREIAGALNQPVVISIQAADSAAAAEVDDAPAIPLSRARMHARLLAETAASLDVKATARLIETLVNAVTALTETTVSAVNSEAAERRHDTANVAMVTQAQTDLIRIARDETAALRAEIEPSINEILRNLRALAEKSAADAVAAAEATLVEEPTTTEPAPIEAAEAGPVVIEPIEAPPSELAPEVVDPTSLDVPRLDVAVDHVADVAATENTEAAIELTEIADAIAEPAPDDAPTVPDAPTSRRRRR